MQYENGSIVLTREEMPMEAEDLLPLSVRQEIAVMMADLDADGSVVEEIVLPEVRLFGRKMRFALEET